MAKTLLVKTLAAALALDCTRVQFTPDLMPADVTGSLDLRRATAQFQFREGPVFTNLLLADEINRTPPKTQAALLEAMEERQVTVEGAPRPLPVPFMVVATQNPVEYEGTYPLPEAQLDRFLFKLSVGLPGRQDEISILTRHADGFDPHDLQAAGLRPVATAADLAAARQAVAQVRIAPEITATSSTSAGPLASPRRCSSASRPAARPRCCQQPRLGLAVGAGLRHARRRQGPGPADPAPPDACCGPRPSSRARPPTACSTASWPRFRCRGNGGPGRMALTGRAALAALIGTLAALAFRSAAGLVVTDGLIALAIGADCALAAGVRQLQVSRSGDSRMLLGQRGIVTLSLANPGRRALRGIVRDAWPPSAGARPGRARVLIPGGGQAHAGHQPGAHPAR